VSTFVDTSGVYAVLDSANVAHDAAKQAWVRLLENTESLLTTSYVVVETYALVQARFGLEGVRTLKADIFPMVDVIWVDEELHHSALTAMLAAQRRGLSLVDCTSFVAMRRMGITRAFAFDRHFEQHGFESDA
jgi:predicted nucleic acid-binding protein